MKLNNESKKEIFDRVIAICYDISLEESKKYNTNFNVLPVNIVSFLKDFNKKFKFDLKYHDLLFYPLKCMGAQFYNYDHPEKTVIYIFLNKINHLIRVNSDVFLELTVCCYHEIWHDIQLKFDPYGYNKFLYEIENFLILVDKENYLKEHNNFSMEIGANLYGITMAKSYLKEKYPEIYVNSKEKINEYERKYSYDYLTFDAVNVVDKLILTLKNILKEREISISDKKKISPVLDIFLKNDITFRSINEIINNENFNKLDKVVVSTILSSNVFLAEKDFEKMAPNELNILKDSLLYTKQIYCNQTMTFKKMLDEKVISNEEYIIAQKKLLAKISSLETILSKKCFKLNVDELVSIEEDRNIK